MAEEPAMTVYEAIGEDGFTRLVREFYRQVPNDDILGPMYPHDDLPAAEQRLKNFLVYRFGGPQRYIDERGNPRLRMRHALFVLNQAARDRWVSLMDRAFIQAQLLPEAERVLRQFFEETATFLINQ